MERIKSFVVEGLFHKARHEIQFSTHTPVTIIAGPNGIGKTHILKLMHAALTVDVATLASSPFDRLDITFANGRRIGVLKGEDEDGDPEVIYEGFGPRGGRAGKLTLPVELFTAPDDDRRTFIRLSNGVWMNRRTGDTLPRGVVPPPRFRHPSTQGITFFEERINEEWIAPLLKQGKPILIDTKRLDTLPTHNPRAANDSPATATSRIYEYIEQVKVQVSDARRASLLESQAADQTFANRVLRRSNKTIPENELKKRYEEIAERHAELYRSGLSGGTVEVEFPSSGVDATERRILTVFLNDWAKKLEPFRAVNDKLTALRRIVNGKFLDKELKLDKSGALAFTSTIDQSDIPVRALSSGEQHILALFTMLLFSAEPASLVLIDEPEISLHAAWKHDFLTDISEVARIADLQVILATHSSAIINGQWDLVRELGVG